MCIKRLPLVFGAAGGATTIRLTGSARPAPCSSPG